MRSTKTLEEKCAERKAQREKDTTLVDENRHLRLEIRKLRKRVKELEASREVFKARAGKMRQKRKGKLPNLERQPGWRKVRSVGTWALWYYPSPGDGWLNMKLVSTARIEGKANYWMGYSLTEGRWARETKGDHAALERDHPDLWAAVGKFIEEQKKWL